MICILFVLGCNKLTPDWIKIMDGCKEDLFYIEFSFNENLNNLLIINLINNGEQVDRIQYEGLMWREQVQLIGDQRLQIELPLRGGMGIHWRRIIILSVCEGKIVESLNIISTEISDHPQMARKEEYRIDYSNLTDGKALTLYETHSSEFSSTDIESWSDTIDLKFNVDDQFFYSRENTEIKDAKIYNTKKLISGYFHSIITKRYTYLFVDEKWYVLNENNVLIR